MLCRMGTELDFVKVLDFGLVKVERPNTETLTAPDATAGTPAYMAPESIDGTHAVDYRADLYALGCVGYWLLVGRQAFDGPNPLAILFKHRSDPVPPITVAGAEELAPIIVACLAKSPEARPASAIEVARSLGRLRDADWTQDDAAHWWSGWAGPARLNRGTLSGTA